jgi:YfiH family protein
MADPQPTDAFTWTQEPWGRALRCTGIAARHLFSSRDLMLGEDPDEWRAVAASLGVAAGRLLLVKQVHGIHVVVARRGASTPWLRPKADIIITDDPGVAIGVRVADCAPVLLHDPVKHAVGAVHAGWRGTASGAAGAAVRAMHATFGSHVSDLAAAIGPCLGACCGEVGPEVVETFRAAGVDRASLDAWFSPGAGDRSFLDLERANRDQLRAAGLNPHAIFSSGLCTKTNREDLHSHRGDGGAAGRMIAAIRAL